MSPTTAPASHAPLRAGGDPLLTPLRLKGLELKNRIMSTSHAPILADGGMPGERYQAYHEEKAKGGIGLTMFGGSSNVSIDSAEIFGQLNLGTDAIVPHFRRFAERIHRHGAALMCQITHLGRRSDAAKGAWLPAIAPSPVRETLFRNIPRQMEGHDIERVVADFGRAARRCRDGGLDGVEVIVSGHLLGQFLSPATNMRTDEFGGSLENRCRFPLMVMNEVRRQVGDDFIFGLRITMDEAIPDGLTFQDTLEVAALLEATGQLDYFNVFFGTLDTALSLATNHMPAIGSPIGPWLEKAAEFKRHVALPVFHAARIADLATARHAVREGLLDLVGMTRAHMADPHLVAKLMRGDEDRIRPCVGASHCRHRPPLCIHNPSTGRELTVPHQIGKAPRPKKAVVVGGGPAGLEAARVLGERGHAVTLFEAAGKLGGQIRLAAEPAWRRELLGIVDWRVAELDHLGVDVRLDTLAESREVLALEPDIVVMATGGQPSFELESGAELLLSPWDALSNPVPAPGRLVVFDGTGRYTAINCADRFARAGHNVSFVTLDNQFGAEMGKSDQVLWRKRVYEAGFDLYFDYQIVGAARAGNAIRVVFRNELTREILEIEAEHLIMDRGTLPENTLFDELRPYAANDGVTDMEAFVALAAQPRESGSDGRFGLHRIGDALASRDIHSAIFDAARLCRAL